MLAPKVKILLSKIGWMLKEKSSLIWDSFLYILPPGQPAFLDPDKTNLLFLGEHLPPRVMRLSKHLRKDGRFRTILFCHRHGFNEKFAGDCFDEIRLFRNKIQLLSLLKAYRGINLVQGFAPRSYYGNVARKNIHVPYIHDLQDVLTNYYDESDVKRWLKAELPHEKECLLLSDGVMAHSLEPNPAYRKLQTKAKPRNIFLHLSCDEDVFRDSGKRMQEAGNIHIVYAGGVAGSFRNPKQYGNTRLHYLVSSFSEQHLHFHIYPSPANQPADYAEYRLLADDNPYFHFHDPVSQSRLADELFAYDYGILPFFRHLSDQSPVKLKYATTLKLFNYLEAGIPVIVSRDLFYQSWLISRFKSGILIDFEEHRSLGNILPDLDYAVLKENVLRARQSLELGRQIPRVAEFYYKIIDLSRAGKD